MGVGPGFSERAWAVDRLLMARRKLFSIPKTSIGTEDRGLGNKAGVSVSHLSTFPTEWTEGNAGRVCLSASNPSALGSQLSDPQRLPEVSVNVHVPSTSRGRGFDGQAACSSPRPRQAWFNFLYVCF